ncbi:FtsW/RodA/SpoVE family cell cycle protein [bacterium]|nr:FtsW/RodA/SpoVE family cell cycle protein [bacterium]
MDSTGMAGARPLTGTPAAIRRDGARRERIQRWIMRLLVVTALLALFGLAMSFSATVFLNIALDRPAYGGFLKHFGFLLLGTFGAFATVILIYRSYPARRWLEKAISAAFFASLALVALVQVPGLGMEVNGATRFLNLGVISFQPSELLKVFLVLYLAKLLCWWRLGPDGQDQSERITKETDEQADYNPTTDVEQQGALTYRPQPQPWYKISWSRDSRPVWPELPKRCMVAVVGALGLTVIQPDLGSTAIIFGCSFLVFVLAGVNLRYLLGFLGALVGIGLLLAGTIAVVDPGRYDYASQRVSTWVNTITTHAEDEDGPAYQLAQARGALAAGGLWGRGFLKSDQKMNRLPLSTSDFIFPVIVEELGYVGGLVVVFLFMALAWCAVRLSFCCRDPFNKTAISALGFTICLQALVNIGVTTGALPLSGLTLPFFSAGGTSIAVSLLAVGFMVALGLSETQQQPAKRSPERSRPACAAARRTTA